MHSSILQILSHPHQQYLDLLPRPLQAPRKNRQAHRLHTIQQVLLRPHPNQLLLLPPRPRIQRPVEVLLDDIHKPRLPHPLAIVLRVRHGSSEVLGRPTHLHTPFRERVPVHGAVDAGDGHLRVLHLEDAVGPERGVGLVDDVRWVAEAREHGTPVDVVELIGVVPWFLGV